VTEPAADAATALWVLYNMASPRPQSNAHLYSEAIAQTEYLDRAGFDRVLLAEHHDCDNQYLPSPMLLGAAIAARTNNIRINPMAIAPLHDPIRLAEDAVVLDNIAQGRLDLTVSLGYRHSEFELFGTTKQQRGARTEAAIAVLRQVFTGEPFKYRGATYSVTPAPATPGGPPLLIGGTVAASARRAARIGDGLQVPGGSREHVAELFRIYREECRRLGKPPGPTYSLGGPLHLQLSMDPDRTWHQLAAHASFELDFYARWAAQDAADMCGPFNESIDARVEVIRAGGLYRVVTPEEAVRLCRELAADGVRLLFCPLVGGLPPEVGWEGLELFVEKVLPELRPTATREHR
jgi:alkanesulfonate monooxygenase SsuD/methylene tetrahydromethanopterin reductase-like flavin-dependent oxidoreductase (luciferase family)